MKKTKRLSKKSGNKNRAGSGKRKSAIKKKPAKKSASQRKAVKVQRLRVGVADASSSVTLNLNVPPGTIMVYIGASAPAGWLLCDGGVINKADFPNLFPMLPAGKLPDLRNKFVLGRGTRRIWDTGGAETHTLQTNELPAHTHGFGVGGGGGDKYSGRSGTDDGYSIEYKSASYKNSTTSTGEGRAHNNMPPYLALNYIIKW